MKDSKKRQGIKQSVGGAEQALRHESKIQVFSSVKSLSRIQYYFNYLAHEFTIKNINTKTIDC